MSGDRTGERGTVTVTAATESSGRMSGAVVCVPIASCPQPGSGSCQRRRCRWSPTCAPGTPASSLSDRMIDSKNLFLIINTSTNGGQHGHGRVSLRQDRLTALRYHHRSSSLISIIIIIAGHGTRRSCDSEGVGLIPPAPSDDAFCPPFTKILDVVTGSSNAFTKSS